ncbi:MAG: vacuolar-type H+-ATPase subunit H [Oscillospiraceae bacterium]|nr:vacuolar-type H+-ATPase subunit H [Oscillospiraceae bacterium]
MSIEEILEDMVELLDKATSMPFSPHKSVIDAERMRELINDARLNVPQEVRQAQSIAYDRDRIIKDAETKAEKIIRQAEERAKTIVGEEAIVKEAKKRALEAVTKAKAESDAIREATDNYVKGRFQEVEKYFSTALQDVQSRKAKFEELQQKKTNGKANQAKRKNK